MVAYTMPQQRKSIWSVSETRDRALTLFQGTSQFYEVVPSAFLANGVYIVTNAGLELTTPAL